VDPTSFYKIEAPLPPLIEQHNISRILSLADETVRRQDRLIQLAMELKKSLLQNLFTKGILGERQKQTEVGSVPLSWKEYALEDTGDVIYGIQAAVAANLKPIGTRILTNKNITLDGHIVTDAMNYFELKTKRHHETLLKKGDL